MNLRDRSIFLNPGEGKTRQEHFSSLWLSKKKIKKNDPFSENSEKVYLEGHKGAPRLPLLLTEA